MIPHHTIAIKKMRVAEEYFGEAFAMCREYGLLPIMMFNKDYDPELIMQFCATIHFQLDDDRTFRWLTNGVLLESNLAKFGTSLGYPRLPGENDNGWRSHDLDFSMDKKVLKPLYIKGWANPGKSMDLLPTWDMLRIYRETINPKGGNFDEIHNFEVDLMYNSFIMQGKGMKLDVMDYIYNELWTFVMEKKLPPYAPFS